MSDEVLKLFGLLEKPPPVGSSSIGVCKAAATVQGAAVGETVLDNCVVVPFPVLEQKV